MTALARMLVSSSGLSQYLGQGLTLKRARERLFGGTELTVLTLLRAGCYKAVLPELSESGQGGWSPPLAAAFVWLWDGSMPGSAL